MEATIRVAYLMIPLPPPTGQPQRQEWKRVKTRKAVSFFSSRHVTQSPHSLHPPVSSSPLVWYSTATSRPCSSASSRNRTSSARWPGKVQSRHNRVQVETAPTPLRDHRLRLANPACDGLSISIHCPGPYQYAAGIHLSQPPAFISFWSRPHVPLSLSPPVSREMMLC